MLISKSYDVQKNGNFVTAKSKTAGVLFIFFKLCSKYSYGRYPLSYIDTIHNDI